MEIKLPKRLCESIGVKILAPYGIDPKRWNWEKGQEVDVSRFSRAKINDLRQLIAPYTGQDGAPLMNKITGAALAYRDITIWLESYKDAGSGKPRTVQQFYSMAKKYLLNQAPGHLLYFRDDARECWWSYYVANVEYHRAYQQSNGAMIPARCHMDLVHWEFGALEEIDVDFWEADVRGRTIAQALAQKNYVVENPELRTIYDTSIERYNANVMEIGKQFWARGIATDDLDGNKKASDSWWGRRVNTIHMDKGGEPSRVVIDLFQEEDTDNSNRRREVNYDSRFWHYEQRRKKVTSDGDSEDDDELEALDYEEDFTPSEVPIHPTVAVFDLRRHARLRIHIDQLTEYAYDRTLGEKLVMPKDDRALIEILLADNSEFADIIAGKGGSSIVLCSGKPGLGKTLTAEVYAEVTERPLYSVQCSQLGISPEELEDELMKTFARSERWNAILLLDEADVYVAPRGSNLQQNAIVGVFLRTLEYYKGVMFMTTNRADLVDDAIASRCIARLNYDVPDAASQLRIWNILGSLAGGVIEEKEARKVVAEFPALSGRDVKNLLKLGILIAKAKGQKKVTAETIRFVKRFKPTMDLKEDV
jgi:AAA+ superfamily predicted ATPase